MNASQVAKGWLKNPQSGSSSGFTLLELLAVVVILTVLVALLVPAYRGVLRSGKGAACLGNMKTYGQAAQLFIAENGGLPWWDGNSPTAQTPGSTYPASELWVRPYLGYTSVDDRLRCPLGSARDLEDKPNSMNYSINSSICFTYPNVQGIPAPHSRVVLAAEMYSHGDGFGYALHLNMTMWGIGEAQGNNKSAGIDEFMQIKNSAASRPAQYHGPENRPGLSLFFLDGHVSLVAPTDGNWNKRPVNAYPTDSGGLFFDRGDFNSIKNGTHYN